MNKNNTYKENLKESLVELQKAIGYTFENNHLLIEALTHSSYMNEMNLDYCNERLEFLGDSLLSTIVSVHLYSNNSKSKEGTLTKQRADLVCQDTLFRFAKKINLGNYLLVSKGEYLSGGTKRPSLLSDAFEALIAAIYLDSNMENTRQFVLSFVIPEIGKDYKSEDYKSKLQIEMQKKEVSIKYIVVDQTGPDHNKEFTVNVLLDGKVKGRGVGASKKSAEQNAAKDALRDYIE